MHRFPSAALPFAVRRRGVAFTFAAACSLLFGACGAEFNARNAPAVGVKGWSSQRNVAIISAIGDQFTLQKIGMTVFGNALDTAQIDSWKIDEAVGRQASAHFGGSANARVVNAPASAFKAFYEHKPFSEPSDRLKDVLRNIPEIQNSDIAVVILKVRHRFGDSNQSSSGIGLLSTSGLMAKTFLHAFYEVRVVDGKTFAPIVTRTAQQEGNNPFFTGMRGPFRVVDETWWIEPSKVQGDQRLKQAVMELLEKSLRETLTQAVATN